MNRPEKMAEMFKSGVGITDIGNEFGVSRQYVQAVLKRAGLDRYDGGTFIAGRIKRAAARKSKDAACLKKYGCTHRQFLDIQRHPDKPTFLYSAHRNRAKRRGIAFEIKLDDWWRIWRTSGHWDQRGTGKNSYCMCRCNDIGPYAVDNVYIATVSENFKDYYVAARSSLRPFMKVADATAGGANASGDFLGGRA